jgi:D-alanine-D-alanine ligase
MLKSNQIMDTLKNYLTRSDLPILLLYNIDREWPAADIKESEQAAEVLGQSLREIGHPVTEARLEDSNLPHLLRSYAPEEYLVFNWCEELPKVPRSASHVTAALEDMGFVFTGADTEALVLAQDKERVKQMLDEHNVPTPRWKVFKSGRVEEWNIFPAIVKPVWEHCSFGVTRDAVVHSSAELSERIKFIRKEFKQSALVEEFIDGREYHVGIIGNGRLKVLPAVEMDFSAFPSINDRLCTYDSKFDSESESYNYIEYRLPAPLTAAERKQLESIALAAYRATHCRDYARLDLRALNGTFYVLDVNPNADFSVETSLAMSAEMSGLSYGELASCLINLAAKRHPVFGKNAH